MSPKTFPRIPQDGRIAFWILAAAFFYLLHLSWLKWGDLVIDSGREMSIPLQLVSGKLLYRDIFYLYGPFSPYWNALFYKVFGVHLLSLALGGALTTAGTAFFFYKLSRLYLSVVLSAWMTLTFLVVSAFGHYVYLANYTYILPYSYPAVHGVLFSLAALYFFYRSFLQGKDSCGRYLICSALVFLCRLEIGVMLLASILPSVIIHSVKQTRDLRTALKSVFIYSLLPLLLAASVYVLFFGEALKILWQSNLKDSLFNNLSLKTPFMKSISGASELSTNTRMFLQNVLFYVTYCLALTGGGLLIGLLDRMPRPGMRRTLKTAAALCVAGFILWGFHRFFYYDFQYRALAVVCAAAAGLAAGRYVKGKEREADLLIVPLALFSLLMLLRIFLHVWVGHYGFYLTVPGMLVYGIFFFKTVPDFLPSQFTRRFFKVNFWIAACIFMASHFQVSKRAYDLHTFPVSAPRGTILGFDAGREIRCRELVDYLRTQTPREATLVVFPEGLTVNFLSERDNPLYYYQFLPIDLGRPEITGQILAEMESKKVDYVALTQRDTSEYGARVFRSDYGQEIWEYVASHYELVRQFGPFPFSSEEYGIALFRRKSEGLNEKLI